jgi:hypothetical protein
MQVIQVGPKLPRQSRSLELEIREPVQRAAKMTVRDDRRRNASENGCDEQSDQRAESTTENMRRSAHRWSAGYQ